MSVNLVFWCTVLLHISADASPLQDAASSGGQILFAEECSTPDGELAYCIPLISCSKLKETIATGDPSPEFIEQFSCGSAPSGLLVCCGGSFDVSRTTQATEPRVGARCLTPNDEEAECAPLYSCPKLKAALATLNAVSIQFVEESRCGGTQADPWVCCGTSSNYTEAGSKTPSHAPDSMTPEGKRVKMKLLATRDYCGYQHSDDYGGGENGSTTKLSEFPWLAGLIYKNERENSDKQPLCGGTLIGKRYVLTAAHCVFSELGPPTTIHLGEYDTSEEEDCVQEGHFGVECSEPVQVHGIQKIIPHPAYDDRSKNNDIALIRLSKSALYDDYVRPICLPFPPTQMAEIGDTLTSSGWGKTANTGSQAKIKKKICSVMITKEECARHHDSEQYKIDDHRICTTPSNTTEMFECQGDSGGPLLFSRKSQWHLEGISSFGEVCGSGIPSVYTRVTSYLDWILENVEK